ncbi:MAG: hypothetical protein KF746_14570 [Chitinophagaceae bacterium]|nr:hypothetical protein [Chitinophagaceae bacterium]
MKKLRVIVFTGFIFFSSLLSQAQTTPNFSVIGTKDNMDGSGLLATINYRCIFVSVSNYDPTNASHFDSIRSYVRNNAGFNSKLSISIYFLDYEANINNLDCNNSSMKELNNKKHLLAFATLTASSPQFEIVLQEIIKFYRQ